MRTHTALALLMPAALLGCATQQTLDAQAEAASSQINAIKQAHEHLASAQQSLDARVSRLESEQALIASRLNHVDTASAASSREVEALRAEAQATQSALGALTGKLDGQASEIAKAQETANDAVKIARDSRLVSGKVADSLLLNESMVSYGYEQPELTARGRAALDQLIDGVRPKLPHVFVEIIGFTDSLSLDSQNRRIALERAESVRRYLHETGGIPLDRMSTISYGDARPVASTTVFSGQSENRRVLVQVLK
jgi:peptidoglycan-associated lipoprotein